MLGKMLEAPCVLLDAEGRFTFLNRHIVLFRKSISIFEPMQ